MQDHLIDDEAKQIFADKVAELIKEKQREAYFKGFEAGMGKQLEDDGLEGVEVHRYVINRYTLYGLVCIVIGSIFSLGMYIGGLQ
jgi:hypothetical protein